MTTTVAAAATSRLAVTTRTGVDNASGVASSSGAARGAIAARTAAAAMIGRGARDSTGPPSTAEEGDGGPAAPGATLAVRPALRRRRRTDYIVLSMFDGIGAAPAILEDLYGEPVAAFLWETDRLCVKLASARLPWMKNRGDLTADSAQAVAAAIEKADPQARAIVIVTAAPPCQDFSRIGSAAGHAPSARHRGVHRRPQPGLPLRERRHGAQGRGGGDRGPGGGTIRRMCVGLWLDIAPTALVDVTGGDDHVDRPGRGKAAPVGQARVVSATEAGRAPSEDMEADGLFFHEAVTSGRLRLPCAATPAEDEQGRPAPKRVRQKLPEPAKARWAADGRRFAPWHYVEEAMMHDTAGRLHIIPPAAKEKLHMLPPGYTAADFLDDRARHKMLANGWHWGVACRVGATRSPGCGGRCWASWRSWS